MYINHTIGKKIKIYKSIMVGISKRYLVVKHRFGIHFKIFKNRLFQKLYYNKMIKHKAYEFVILPLLITFALVVFS